MLTIQYLGEEHSLSAALIHARTSRRVTMREVALVTGMNHSTIVTIEHGLANPNAANLVALCRYFNLDMSTLEDV